jgi:chromosome segregation ATPase
MTWRAIPARP